LGSDFPTGGRVGPARDSLASLIRGRFTVSIETAFHLGDKCRIKGTEPMTQENELVIDTMILIKIKYIVDMPKNPCQFRSVSSQSRRPARWIEHAKGQNIGMPLSR
jgi:hypothetical protein